MSFKRLVSDACWGRSSGLRKEERGTARCRPGRFDRQSERGSRLDPGRLARRRHRSGAGGGATQATVLVVIEAATGRLEVALRLLHLGADAMIDQSVEAGQAGTRPQEQQEQERRSHSAEQIRVGC
jgi:hypothetical protein